MKKIPTEPRDPSQLTPPMAYSDTLGNSRRPSPNELISSLQKVYRLRNSHDPALAIGDLGLQQRPLQKQ